MKTYLVTLVTFVVIDLLWLGIVAKNLYRNNLGHLMRPSPNWYAAAVFYLLFIFGLVFFAVNPALEKAMIKTAIINGLLFGLLTYATYDLTNLATLKDWPLKITIIDIIWGTILGGSVSTVSYYILSIWKK